MKKIYIAATVSLLVFIVTAVFVVYGKADTLNNLLMEAVYSWETPLLTAVLKIITNIGEWFVYVPIALFLIIFPKTRGKFGFPVVVTLAEAAVINILLKLCFTVPRPNTHRLIAATGFGFPSGHAMIGTAFVGICVLLFARYSSNRRYKSAVYVLAVLFVLTVGFSRVYLGVHNPTDVVAGHAMGLFLCLLALCVTNKVKK